MRCAHREWVFWGHYFSHARERGHSCGKAKPLLEQGRIPHNPMRLGSKVSAATHEPCFEVSTPRHSAILLQVELLSWSDCCLTAVWPLNSGSSPATTLRTCESIFKLTYHPDTCFLLQQAWYFTSFSTSAMLQPLLNLYFKRSGLSEVQIGVITAMKPWTSAVAGLF